jgi:predicted FMN-binding regulatory protein PaiB
MMKTIDINLTTIIESYSIIEQNSLGNLVFLDGKDFKFLRVPFYFELTPTTNNLKLYCFIKKNNLTQSPLENKNLSISFNGAYAYITPTWLNNGSSFDFNFQSIHINGAAKKINEIAIEVFTNYIDQMEAKILRAANENVDIESLVYNALQHFDVYEIIISKFENANQIGENLNETEKLKVIQELKKQNEFNSLLLAFEMEQAIKKSRRNNKA